MSTLFKNDKNTLASYVYDPVGNSWVKKADLPFKVTGSNACAASLYGKIYVFRGLMPLEANCCRVYVYDPKQNSWADAGALPPDFNSYSKALSFNGLIYVMSYNGYFKTFNPLSDPSSAWTVKSSCSTTGYTNFMLFNMNNKVVYISPGKTCTYNDAANTWSSVNSSMNINNTSSQIYNCIYTLYGSASIPYFFRYDYTSNTSAN